MKKQNENVSEPSTTELPHTPCNGFTLQQPRLLLTRHHPTCLLCGEYVYRVVKYVSHVVKYVSRVVKDVSRVLVW